MAAWFTDPEVRAWSDETLWSYYRCARIMSRTALASAEPELWAAVSDHERELGEVIGLLLARGLGSWGAAT